MGVRDTRLSDRYSSSINCCGSRAWLCGPADGEVALGRRSATDACPGAEKADEHAPKHLSRTGEAKAARTDPNDEARPRKLGNLFGPAFTPGQIGLIDIPHQPPASPVAPSPLQFCFPSPQLILPPKIPPAAACIHANPHGDVVHCLPHVSLFTHDSP